MYVIKTISSQENIQALLVFLLYNKRENNVICI